MEMGLILNLSKIWLKLPPLEHLLKPHSQITPMSKVGGHFMVTGVESS